MASTTSSSTSVKPFSSERCISAKACLRRMNRPRCPRHRCGLLKAARTGSFPIADIGILALAPFAAVGAVAVNLEVAALPARRRVTIGIAPWVVGQALDQPLAD